MSGPQKLGTGRSQEEDDLNPEPQSAESRCLEKDLDTKKETYTLARKYYIHNFLFLELISRKFTFQLQKNICLELIFPKFTFHVFVCDSENYM